MEVDEIGYKVDCNGEAEVEATLALMSDYIREQEREIWMYSSFLNK